MTVLAKDARTESPLVDISNLRVGFPSGARTISAVDGISFTIDRGQSVAIVGESGSGKSVTARSLVGLTGAAAQVDADRLRIDGSDAAGFSERQWRKLRGKQVGFVLQDALTSLDPLRTIGAEIGEVLRTHRIVPNSGINNRVVVHSFPTRRFRSRKSIV